MSEYHCLRCHRYGSSRTLRHNSIRDALAAYLRACLSNSLVQVEGPLNDPLPSKQTLRADLQVSSGGKPTIIRLSR